VSSPPRSNSSSAEPVSVSGRDPRGSSRLLPSGLPVRRSSPPCKGLPRPEQRPFLASSSAGPRPEHPVFLTGLLTGSRQSSAAVRSPVNELTFRKSRRNVRTGITVVTVTNRSYLRSLQNGCRVTGGIAQSCRENVDPVVWSDRQSLQPSVLTAFPVPGAHDARRTLRIGGHVTTITTAPNPTCEKMD
jgi:hypothetical protein